MQREASSLLRRDKMPASLSLLGSCTESGTADGESGEEADGSAEPGRRLFLGYRVCLTQQRALHLGELQGLCHAAGQQCSVVGVFPTASLLQRAEDPSCGRAPCFVRGCASPASPVLSPVPLLPAAQLGGFPWAAAEPGPDISNGPIMPDVFTAFGRK